MKKNRKRTKVLSKIFRYVYNKGIQVKAVVILISLILVGCKDTKDVYTLYRTSVIVQNARIHVATFDSSDGEKYNSEECFHAVDLYQNQPNVLTRFWCEKGLYK